MRRESNGKAPPFRPLPESGPQCSLVRPGTSRLLPRGRPLADGARQRTAPQCKTLKEKQIKSDFAPRLPTPRSVRLLGILTSNVRHRDDGAIDSTQTDSHDPRPAQTLRGKRKVWHLAFSFPPLRRRLFFGKTKKSGGRNPPGISRPSKKRTIRRDCAAFERNKRRTIPHAGQDHCQRRPRQQPEKY